MPQTYNASNADDFSAAVTDADNAGGGTINIGASFNVTASASTTVPLTINLQNHTLGVNNLGDPDGSISVTGGGANSILTLTGTNTFGELSGSGSVIAFDSNAALGSGTTIALTSETLRALANVRVSENITLAGAGATFDTNGYTMTVSGVIRGTSSLYDYGAGSLDLTGANTYTGTTNVLAGAKLQVDGSTAAASAVTVASGGFLGGTGTIAGRVTDSGTLSAGGTVTGALIGTLTTGALTLNSTATFREDVASTSSADLVDAGGAVAVGGTLDIETTHGFTSSTGQSITLIDNTSGQATTGRFANLVVDGSVSTTIGTDNTFTAAGRTYQINYAANVDGGTTGNDVTLTDITATPTTASSGGDTAPTSPTLQADNLVGTSGNDTIAALAGDDTVYGQGGNDLILGNQGNDLITVTDGANTVFGGMDQDTISAGNGPNVLLGNEGNDVITAGSGMNTVFGGMGNDMLTVGDGGDLLFGGEGVDTITAGNGNNTIVGGTGNSSSDSLDGADYIVSGSGNDLILGNGGDDMVGAGAGSDTVAGGFGNDVILGQQGDDFILGNQGDDTLVGGMGADTLVGGQGNDVLYGNQGDDVLYGNEGLNTFVFNPGDTAFKSGTSTGDTVMDFATGTDRIDFASGPAGTASNFGATSTTSTDFASIQATAQTLINGGDSYAFVADGTDGFLFTNGGSGTAITDAVKLVGAGTAGSVHYQDIAHGALT